MHRRTRQRIKKIFVTIHGNKKKKLHVLSIQLHGQSWRSSSTISGGRWLLLVVVSRHHCWRFLFFRELGNCRPKACSLVVLTITFLPASADMPTPNEATVL